MAIPKVKPRPRYVGGGRQPGMAPSSPVGQTEPPGPPPGLVRSKTDYEAVLDDLCEYLHYEMGFWVPYPDAQPFILKNQLLLQYIDGLVIKHTKGN